MRVSDWFYLLVAWSNRISGQAFAWGERDCALICFDAFDVMTGRYVARNYRGRWHDAASAIRYQWRNKTDLARELERLAVVRIPGSAPLVGDFILHPYPDPAQPFMVGHICFGEFSLGAHIEHGICAARTASVLAESGAGIWRIPECR